MKVTTDSCLFGAIVVAKIEDRKPACSKGVLSDQQARSKIQNVLDVGTGTGLLSLMLVQKHPGLRIDAIEIDKASAAQARENAEASSWKDRINVIHADIKTCSFSKKYDLMISNPPFYENELRSPETKKNFARHGDALLFEELLAIIRKNLAPGGLFFLLLPFRRTEEIKNILVRHEFAISQLIFVRQSVHHDYFRIILTGKSDPGSGEATVIDELSIRDENNQYTKEFIQLLKDYYLYL